MPSYRPAQAPDHRLVHDVAAEFHPDLRRVRLGVVVSEADDAPPSPVAVRLTSPAVRASGAPDVLLLIDKDAWIAMDDADRRAAVDNALASLVVRVKDGQLVSDAAGRPLLRRRRPELALNTYKSVVARHGRRTPGFEAAVALTGLARPTPSSRLPSDRTTISLGEFVRTPTPILDPASA